MVSSGWPMKKNLLWDVRLPLPISFNRGEGQEISGQEKIAMTPKLIKRYQLNYSILETCYLLEEEPAVRRVAAGLPVGGLAAAGGAADLRPADANARRCGSLRLQALDARPAAQTLVEWLRYRNLARARGACEVA
jgi:hypothetical protein